MSFLKIALLTTDKREHDRDYQNPCPSFGTAPSALLEGFSNLPDLEVHVLSCTQQPISSPAKLANNIWFHPLHVPKIGWLRAGYFGCILAIRKKLKEIQPDIVHGQGTERDCAISSVFSGYPNVITVHGNMAELARLFHARWGSFNWWAARLENFTLPRTSGVFCNSAHTQSLVAPRTKLTWVVPNSLRSVFFFKLADVRMNIPVLHILVIGSVTPNKRQLEILSCLRGLQNKGIRFQVVFIGSVNNDAYCRRFLANLSDAKKEGWASFSGFLNELDLIQIMDKAHALLHFPQEEAFGLVVAESLARGLKLFASKVGGICDIASGVPEAELFEPEDWDGLARALSAWLKKPSLSSAFTQNLMKSRYHPNVIAIRHVEIYREVLSASRLS